MKLIIFLIVFVSILVASVLISMGSKSNTFGYTGEEIIIKLNNAQFIPTNGTSNYQVKVIVNYSVSDPVLVGQRINAVMKVHSENGSVLKTTSFPTGITANETGSALLVTNIPKALAQNINTETFFTNLNKTSVLSNIVKTLPPINPVPPQISSSNFTPTVITNQT